MFYKQIQAARTTANLIDLFKWIVLGGHGLIGVIVGLFVMVQVDVIVGFGVWFVTVVGCLVGYVMFGWFSHTLRMLTVTAEQADRQAVAA